MSYKPTLTFGQKLATTIALEEHIRILATRHKFFLQIKDKKGMERLQSHIKDAAFAMLALKQARFEVESWS